MGGDTPVDSEMLLMIDFMNFRIKLAQSFRVTHKNRMRVYIFIEMSAHTEDCELAEPPSAQENLPHGPCRILYGASQRRVVRADPARADTTQDIFSNLPIPWPMPDTNSGGQRVAARSRRCGLVLRDKQQFLLTSKRIAVQCIEEAS
jgi:hypothetical protein